MSVHVPRWEYRAEVISIASAASQAPAGVEELNQQLSALGDDGWDLVGIQPLSAAELSVRKIFCIFKRPKQ